MGVNDQRELDRLAHSAWVMLKQILEINCDFETKGTPPKATTHLHRDLTAFAHPLGSCPNNPAKSTSAHAFGQNVPSFFAVISLSVVPARQ